MKQSTIKLLKILISFIILCLIVKVVYNIRNNKDRFNLNPKLSAADLGKLFRFLQLQGDDTPDDKKIIDFITKLGRISNDTTVHTIKNLWTKDRREHKLRDVIQILPLAPVTPAEQAVTEPPAAATEPPAAATEPPAAVTEPPVAATEPPAAATEPPAAATEPPAAATEPPQIDTTTVAQTRPMNIFRRAPMNIFRRAPMNMNIFRRAPMNIFRRQQLKPKPKPVPIKFNHKEDLLKENNKELKLLNEIATQPPKKRTINVILIIFFVLLVILFLLS